MTLTDYAPTILDDLDHYSIDRKCWMCQHFATDDPIDRCTSLEQAQGIRDLTGVNFSGAMILPVLTDTDASSCSEFLLSHEEAVRLDVLDMIQDARIEAQRHDDHYRRLRREYYA